MQETSPEPTGHPMRDAIVLVVFVAVVVWVGIRWLMRSDDPGRLVVKWILTVLVSWIMIRKVAPMVWTGTFGAWVGMHLVALCGLMLAAIWRHHVVDLIAKPFASIYDGGGRSLEPAPYYSMAQARRKRGDYAGAIGEIRRQLEKFPNDCEGQLMLAEILVEDMNDLPGAELTVHRMCQQPGHTPRQVAVALNFLADWHLKYAQDRDAARRELEQIVTRYPDSELSVLAAQRIAHLADTAYLLETHDRRRIAMTRGVQDVGLLSEAEQPTIPEADLGRVVEAYVQHLEAHPLDTEAREKLAILYADHYQRLDLAADQLEQLITHPHQPARRVVHWLNLLADVQIRHGANYEVARQTVQRIIDLYPGSAAAQTARNRLDRLKLEIKGQTKSPSVKLGSYDQDVGLRG
jgi:tetratricopeptide (TPR) repeat protein